MESYSVSSVEKAFIIFMELLKKGELGIDENRELFKAFTQDSEVYDIIKNIIEKHSNTTVIKTEDFLYITPDIDNKIFGYTNEELRKRINLTNNIELYTVYFIILCLVALFYSGESYDMKYRQYITVEELEAFITEKAKHILEKKDRQEKIEKDIKYNFTSMAEKWLDMPEYDEKIVKLAASKSTRLSFIVKACRFLEEENLTKLHDEREIYTTPKMDRMVTSYYTSASRKDKILSILEDVKPDGREEIAQDKPDSDS